MKNELERLIDIEFIHLRYLVKNNRYTEALKILNNLFEALQAGMAINAITLEDYERYYKVAAIIMYGRE